MHRKSDIEQILESQTWKQPKKPPRRNQPQAKKLVSIKPKKISIQQKVPQIPDLLSPILPKENHSRKSFLAINLNSMSSSISTLVKNDELNLVRIPTFPKSPFGIHSDSRVNYPTFKVIPKPPDLNIDNIKAIKLESGRIKRVIAKSASNSSLGFYCKKVNHGRIISLPLSPE